MLPYYVGVCRNLDFGPTSALVLALCSIFLYLLAIVPHGDNVLPVRTLFRTVQPIDFGLQNSTMVLLPLSSGRSSLVVLQMQ